MSKKLRQAYPAAVAVALSVALLYDGALFIVAMAGAIAALPLAYGDQVDDIARRTRARQRASDGDRSG